MQVLLLERIGRLGQMGDVVKVRDGYARNFLLPKGKAMRATKANLSQFEQQRAQLEAQNLELKKEADAVAKKLDGKSFIALRQASDSGQLYGSVSTRDISETVTEGGFTVTRNQILLDRPIKTLGRHLVRIGLHPEVTVSVTVNVARTMEEAERQARGEDVTALRDEDEEERAQALAAATELFDEEAAQPDAEEGKAEDVAESGSRKPEDLKTEGA
jgi:large subunit ribosomal protein L9